MNPTYPGIDSPPAGVTFDTAAEIHDRAAQIEQLAVKSTAMPLGNATKMTPDERKLLGDWVADGAPTR